MSAQTHRLGSRQTSEPEPRNGLAAARVGVATVAGEAPLLAVRDGHAIHLADRAAVREHLRELMTAYAESGATRADIAELEVVDLGRSSAIATVHWHVRGADGAMVKEFRTTYHLLREGESWRILSYSNHD